MNQLFCYVHLSIYLPSMNLSSMNWWYILGMFWAFKQLFIVIVYICMLVHVCPVAWVCVSKVHKCVLLQVKAWESPSNTTHYCFTDKFSHWAEAVAKLTLLADKWVPRTCLLLFYSSWIAWYMSQQLVIFFLLISFLGIGFLSMY